MWDKKRNLMNRYDSTADFYDNRYQEIQKRKFQEVSEDLRDAEKILDVGCGTGLFLNEISDWGELVVGVDFSEYMVKNARERVKDAFLVLSDADNLPFKDESFDAVVSLTLLQNMPNPDLTIQELTRVTEQDGKIIMTVLEKKHSVEEVKNWMFSANLKPLRVGRISDSEDILCVGRREK